MKCSVSIDASHSEEVVIHAHARTKLVCDIEQLCADDALELIGTNERGAVRISPAEVCCFIVEGGRIYALTQDDRLQLGCRLYTLCEALSDDFVKLNQSCLANIRMIARFEASIGGALMVRFKNGYTDYVSRRNLKNVKARMGL